jgi:hypothetical protein
VIWVLSWRVCWWWKTVVLADVVGRVAEKEIVFLYETLEVFTVAMLRLASLESRARPCHPTGEMICLEGLIAALETDIAGL